MQSVLVTIFTDEGESLFEMSYDADVTHDEEKRDRLLRDVAEALR